MSDQIRPSYYQVHIPKRDLVDHSEDCVLLECFTLIRVLTDNDFSLGNVLKYLWRAGRKSSAKVEDLRKARTYLDHAIEDLEGREAVS